MNAMISKRIEAFLNWQRKEESDSLIRDLELLSIVNEQFITLSSS
jgi:glutamyl-tRNA reductase